jgi:hypothetical protein
VSTPKLCTARRWRRPFGPRLAAKAWALTADEFGNWQQEVVNAVRCCEHNHARKGLFVRPGK